MIYKNNPLLFTVILKNIVRKKFEKNDRIQYISYIVLCEYKYFL